MDELHNMKMPPIENLLQTIEKEKSKKSHCYQDKSTSGVKDLFKTKRLQLKCETKTADTRPANFKFQFSGTINIYLRDQNFY